MINLDLDQPLATLLKDSTKKAHDVAQNSKGLSMLLSGQLPRGAYARYLMLLWHVYDTLEEALDRHSDHPSLEPVYNPMLFARAPALSADISYFLQVPETEWLSHPLHKQMVADMPVPLTTYLNRIRTLADSEDPSPLLAHCYVRYVGDMSGGQIIGRLIEKAYGLGRNSTEGLEFYTFKELRSSKTANQGEIKRIKEWFKEGMNTAGKQGPEMKAKIVEESLLVYTLNINLLAELCDQTPCL